jgi:hypothetical protein
MKISQASGREVAKTLKCGALFWYRKTGVSQNSTAARGDTGALASRSPPGWGGMNPSCKALGHKNIDLNKAIQ